MKTSFFHMFKKWSPCSTNKSISKMFDMKKYQLLISVKVGDKLMKQNINYMYCILLLVTRSRPLELAALD